MIVSFEVLFKTPVTANEGLAKLRDTVDNNKRLGNFTVEALKIIQPAYPSTAASTEGSTGTVCNSSQKGDLTVKSDMHIREICNHVIDGNKNVKKALGLPVIINKHFYSARELKKKLFTSFPTLHGYVKFPDATFYCLRSKNTLNGNFPVSFRTWTLN